MIVDIIPGAIGICTPEEYETAKDNYSTLWVYDGKRVLRHENLTFNRKLCLEVDMKNVPKSVKDKLPEVPAIPEVKEFLNFLPAGKPSKALLDQIVEFFRQVSKEYKSDVEAHVFIMWNPEKGYYITVPRQKVSKASVHYEMDAETVPPGDVIVIDCHSHNTMGAFFSSTDDGDDKSKINFSGVVGHLDKPEPAIVFRFNLLEEKRKIDVKDLFEAPKEEVSVPAEWMDRIEREVYTAPNYRGAYNFGGAPRGNVYDLINRQIAEQSVHGGNRSELGKGKSGAGSIAAHEARGNLWAGFDWSDWGVGDGVDDLYGTSSEGPILTIDPVSGGVFDAAGSEVGQLSEDDVASLMASDEIKEEILDGLTGLEDRDADLLEIIRRAKDLMTERGQTSLMTNGL